MIQLNGKSRQLDFIELIHLTLERLIKLTNDLIKRKVLFDHYL